MGATASNSIGYYTAKARANLRPGWQPPGSPSRTRLLYHWTAQRTGPDSRPNHCMSCKIDAQQNALIVGPAQALERTSFTVSNMHYVSGEIPTEPFEAAARVRYKAAEQPALVTPLQGNRAQVTLLHPQRADHTWTRSRLLWR